VESQEEHHKCGDKPENCRYYSCYCTEDIAGLQDASPLGIASVFKGDGVKRNDVKMRREHYAEEKHFPGNSMHGIQPSSYKTIEDCSLRNYENEKGANECGRVTNGYLHRAIYPHAELFHEVTLVRAVVPHSGQRSGVARRSYSHEAHMPGGLRFLFQRCDCHLKERNADAKEGYDDDRVEDECHRRLIRLLLPEPFRTQGIAWAWHGGHSRR
jgi:hypothetical protein